MKDKIKKIIFLNCLFFSVITNANPFKITFPEKEELSIEDWTTLEKTLQAINLNPILHEYYNECEWKVGCYESFYNRISRGINWAFFDRKKGLFPTKKLTKINNGGESCIVCVASCGQDYPDLLMTQELALKEVGFDGYYLSFIGALPNPTGKEIQYAGIPYAFKIFAMLEAQKLGFNKVLWLDSALLPLENPKKIFEQIDQVGGYVHFYKNGMAIDRSFYMLPKTRDELEKITGVDVLTKKIRIDQAVFACVFGFKMDHRLSQELVNIYLECVNRGTPFLSSAPEEAVLSAILGREEFLELVHESKRFDKTTPVVVSENEPNQYIFNAILRNCFFFWRKHSWPNMKGCIH